VYGRYVRFVLAVIFFLDGGWPLFKFQKKILGYLSAASRQTFFTSLAVWLLW
jgi:hypothetical protein